MMQPEEETNVALAVCAAEKMREALLLLDQAGASVVACLLQQALDVLDPA